MRSHLQLEIPIIKHEIETSPVNQRATDGYINATEMCNAAGKQFSDYSRLNTTSEFLEELSLDTGIPRSKLTQSFIGRPSQLQGTWVHPDIAVNLAQWLSPKFAVQVSKWVRQWLSGQGRIGLPDHVRRYFVNQHQIPNTHFSMLNQMIFRLLGPLEKYGYILPPHMMPDIALGKMFSKWLREQEKDPDGFPTYRHVFLDNRKTVDARLYPNELMTEFNEQLTLWITEGGALEYFSERDSESIEPFKRVMALPKPTIQELPE